MSTYRQAKVQHAFKAPCRMPNGLQGTRDGLWLVDQIDDDVYLVDSEGGVLNRLMTGSGNSSGLTYGGRALWLGLNGGPNLRPERPWDRHGTWVVKASPKTGKTLAAFELPGEGGVHGIEWGRGKIWVTRPGIRRIVQVIPGDFSVVDEFEVGLDRLHGLAWVGDGLWAAHTADRVLVKYDVKTGRELDAMVIPEPHPSPHGLTTWQGALWYCDADTGDVCRIEN